MRQLRDSVVVITGASSGIGRAAAVQFAKHGSAVVVAARRGDRLDEVAGECERHGARALAMTTDVTDQAQVDRLAAHAVAHFGRIDVWVNNAAVTMFARFEDAPMDAVRQVIETNVFGYVYGARAALKVFREQGSGVLINNASVVSEVPQPYTSIYVMTKYAIRAMGKSLRQELALDGVPIQVCTVLPATIDTPLFQHGANYTGRAAKAMPPVYPAEMVARVIVRLAQKPKREVFAGRAGRMLALQHIVAPAASERMFATMVDRRHLEPDRSVPATAGNLFEPMPDGATVSGGWRAQGGGGRSLTRVAMVALPALAAWWWRSRRGEATSRQAA